MAAKKVGIYILTSPSGKSRPTYRRLIRLGRLYGCDFREFLNDTSKLVWMHFETVLVETVLFQALDMEEGKVPNLDFDQVLRLSERLGVFDLEPEGVEEETAAQEQLGREIR